MDPQLLSSVARLSNAELLACVKRLAERERQATVMLVAHLAELDERCLYLAEGYASLFSYCTQGLHLSEHAAYNRIEAARAVRRFPVLLERLADGSVTLTTIRLLAPHLTPENHLDLLEKARHQSKRTVEELMVQLCPLPPVPATIRRLPSPRHRLTACTAIAAAHAGLTPCAESPDGVAGGGPAASEPQSVTSGAGDRTPWIIAPLSPQRYKIQFTASMETHAKLRQAQALLRHQVPDGDVATIIDRALTALLEQVAKHKVAATRRPRQHRDAVAVPRSRHIPNAVKRQVWIRDGGRCAFVGKQGRRCSADGFLEFHHVRPYAAGGEATAENIQLRCRAHNGYEAELYFGPRTSTGVKEGRATFAATTEDTRRAPPQYSGDSFWNELGVGSSGQHGVRSTRLLSGADDLPDRSVLQFCWGRPARRARPRQKLT